VQIIENLLFLIDENNKKKKEFVFLQLLCVLRRIFIDFCSCFLWFAGRSLITNMKFSQC